MATTTSTQADRRRRAEQRLVLGAMFFAAATGLLSGVLAVGRGIFSPEAAFIGIFAGLLIYASLLLLLRSVTRKPS